MPAAPWIPVATSARYPPSAPRPSAWARSLSDVPMNTISSSGNFIWMAGICLARLLSHLSVISRAKCARLLKSEIRNSNLETNRKSERREKFKPPASRLLLFELSAFMLFRISSFEIRISRRSFWFRLRRVGPRSALRKPEFSFDIPPLRGGLRSLSVGADCIATEYRALSELLS